MENKLETSLLMKQHENHILLDAINQAVESAPLHEEEKLSLRRMHRRQQDLPASEW
jgi:hypothetical protein